MALPAYFGVSRHLIPIQVATRFGLFSHGNPIHSATHWKMSMAPEARSFVMKS
jgi:hypothetical protein